jgi:SAM-dependent methyltransferase
MELNQFINKVKPHGVHNSAPPHDIKQRHFWESLQLFSIENCLNDYCSVLDYGCGGGGTLQHTLFNHYPNAKYYGLDIEFEGIDNKGFSGNKIKNNNNIYFGYIDEIENILPKVDGMVMGSVFTHLSLNKMEEILNKTLPHYERGFELGFTSFLGDDFQFYGSHAYGNDPDTWEFTIIKYSWYEEYCEKNNLEIILHPYFYTTPFTLPNSNGINKQNFITIKKR